MRDELGNEASSRLLSLLSPSLVMQRPLAPPFYIFVERTHTAEHISRPSASTQENRDRELS
jgi:hypothetical protein